MVFQVQLTKDQKALPLTRDYINTSKHDLRAHHARPQPARRVQQSPERGIGPLVALANSVPPRVVHSPTP